jgi:peroxiredoxin Q/BCP
MRSVLFLATLSFLAFSAPVPVGGKAPLFELKNQDGKTVSLADRKGKWTVLYFYPKSGTPGCTKQACAFRDAILKIRETGAEVYGISADTVADQAKFHKEHHLKFDLLADPDLTVIKAYGVQMDGVNMAKRWTFIVDPTLTIRSIDTKVDPAMDPARVTERLTELKRITH